MKTTFCRTTTEDKLRLDGLLFEPRLRTKKGILHIHGMGGNFYENAFLDAMAENFTKEGYAFLTVNNRGHDQIADLRVDAKTEKYKRVGNVFERVEECVLDIQAWINFFESKGYDHLVLQGHSLGAVKAVYFLSQHPANNIKAVVLASPPDMIGLTKTAEEIENYKRDRSEAEKLTKEKHADTLLSNKLWDGYYRSANSYIDFTTDNGPVDMFPTLRGGEFAELKAIQEPVLAFYGGKDDAAVFSPERDLSILGRHLIHEKSKTLVIANASHSYFGHENLAAQEIIDWVKVVA